MKTDDVIVKTSKIHGKGVFAKRNFKKGEEVTSNYIEELPLNTKKNTGSDPGLTPKQLWR